MTSNYGSKGDTSLHRFWKFFASVKLTIGLLIALATVSIMGTIIPQNEAPAAYLQAFGPFLYRLLDLLGLLDIFHSWWFLLLLILIITNIVVCSIDRLSANLRIIFNRSPAFNLARFQRIEQNEAFNDERPPDVLKPLYQSFVQRRFHSVRLQDTEQGFAVFGEKGRWSRLGVYIVHLSVILLALGGFITLVFGFEGFVTIAEGEAVEYVQNKNGGELRPLGFTIRCDDFEVSKYESGLPKEYRSRLTVLEDGREVLTRDIIVNDPLRYKGFSIFQASYGELPTQGIAFDRSQQIPLIFTSKATGMQYPISARIGEMITIPEGLGSFVITQFRESHDFRGKELGPTLIAQLTQKNGMRVEVILPLQFPSFDRMSTMLNAQRGDALFISVGDIKAVSEMPAKKYYTGLQISRDPGVWIVYLGFAVIIIGCYITFFMSHQQLCIEVRDGSRRSRIRVAGIANKNKMGMRKLVKQVSLSLARL